MSFARRAAARGGVSSARRIAGMPSILLAVATLTVCACTTLVVMEIGAAREEAHAWELHVVELEARSVAAAQTAAAAPLPPLRSPPRSPPRAAVIPPPLRRTAPPPLPRTSPPPPPRLALTAAATSPLPAACGAGWPAKYAALHRDLIAKGGPFLAVDCRDSTAASPCNGLGDRTRGVAFLLALAVLSNRALLIDWGYPHPLQENLIPAGAVDWTHRPANYASRMKPLLWHRSGQGDWIDDTIIARDLPPASSPAIPLIKTNSDSLRRLWKSPRWAAALALTGLGTMDVDYRFGCAWRYLFQPSPGLAGVLSHYSDALRRGAGSLPATAELPALLAPPPLPLPPPASGDGAPPPPPAAIIGMHFRAGDGFQGTAKSIVGNGHLWGGGIDATIADYVACGRAIEKRFHLGRAVWLVAADNADFKKRLRAAAPDRVAILDLREAEHGHLDSGAGKMLDAGEVAHRLAPHATRFVFNDLLLLAQSDFMLQTGSMFPEAAASIGFVPPRKRMWVKGCADPAVARAAAGTYDDKLNWYTGLGTPE